MSLTPYLLNILSELKIISALIAIVCVPTFLLCCAWGTAMIAYDDKDAPAYNNLVKIGRISIIVFSSCLLVHLSIQNDGNINKDAKQVECAFTSNTK